MSEKDFEISRRKALAGIGVVGVASAGAELGTTAYFSDQEEFDGNTITAGEFSMTVEPNSEPTVNQGGIGPDELGKTDEGVFAGGSINITDAKPGDNYEFCWNISINDNPGYVAVFADNVVNYDGADPNNEEANVDVGDIYDLDSDEDLETLEDNVNASVEIDGGEVWSGTLGELLTDLQGENGLSLPNQIDAGTTVTVCVILTINFEDVGNEIQDAFTSADLIFYAEQARHNSNFPSGSPVDDNGDEEENGDNGS